MTQFRHHDNTITSAPARTERVYSNDELWYFRTRENKQVGPFRYRCEAQSGLERFLSDLKNKL
jgi:hypothetical protein